jgi:hypothetical protein
MTPNPKTAGAPQPPSARSLWRVQGALFGALALLGAIGTWHDLTTQPKGILLRGVVSELYWIAFVIHGVSSSQVAWRTFTWCSRRHGVSAALATALAVLAGQLGGAVILTLIVLALYLGVGARDH